MTARQNESLMEWNNNRQTDSLYKDILKESVILAKQLMWLDINARCSSIDHKGDNFINFL